MARKLALLIGNSQYKNLPLLKTPLEDVTNLARVLRDPRIGGFDKVTTLVDRSAQEIRMAVAQLFKQKAADDLLLLYFSGHGVKDVERDASLYLAVHDTDKELLSATAIPASFILDEIEHCRSERNILILDCCYSGAFARGAKAGDVAIGTGDIFKGSGRGKVVLTASDAANLAWEGSQVLGVVENSLFTHFLINGLETGLADHNDDGKITLNELYEYAYAEVTARNRKQTPGKWEYEGQGGAIVLARNPIVRAEPLAADLQEMLKDNRPLVRKSAITELVQILRGSNEGLAKSARLALESLERDDSRAVSEAAQAALTAFDRDHPSPSGTKGEPRAGSWQQPRTSSEQAPRSTPPSREQPTRQAVPRAETSSLHVSLGRFLGMMLCLTVLFWIAVGTTLVPLNVFSIAVGMLAVAMATRGFISALSWKSAFIIAGSWGAGAIVSLIAFLVIAADASNKRMFDEYGFRVTPSLPGITLVVILAPPALLGGMVLVQQLRVARRSA